MTSMKPGATGPTETAVDLLVVGATKGLNLAGAAAEVDAALDGELLRHLRQTSTLGGDPFEGKAGHAAVVPTFGRIAAGSVMVAGLGEAGRVDAESVRRAAGVAARASGGFGSVALDLGRGIDGGGTAAAEGFRLGSYSFDRFLTDKPRRSGKVIVLGATKAEVARAEAYAGAALWARDLVNEPPSDRGPQVVADLARTRAKEAGLKVEVLDEDAMAKQGMNGILTVGRGSDSPPRFLVITYDPRGARGFVGLVGKGITFDSGGLSIKTSEGMETMKMDCSGGAAVIAAVTALPQLKPKPKVKVVAAIALAENMPGGAAVKPGDVIRHYGGRTSEVLNTDAEGRLVLADALAWMAEQEPDAMVDVATLTGAMMVALGRGIAGVFANRTELCSELIAASKRTGEQLWSMPLFDDYRHMISSPVADVKNISGNRFGGAIVAALFLKDFVGQTPWAHLDIAGPAWVEKPEHYLSAGASGYGTRLLLDWIAGRAG